MVRGDFRRPGRRRWLLQGRLLAAADAAASIGGGCGRAALPMVTQVVTLNFSGLGLGNLASTRAGFGLRPEGAGRAAPAATSTLTLSGLLFSWVKRIDEMSNDLTELRKLQGSPEIERERCDQLDLYVHT